METRLPPHEFRIRLTTCERSNDRARERFAWKLNAPDRVFRRIEICETSARRVNRAVRRSLNVTVVNFCVVSTATCSLYARNGISPRDPGQGRRRRARFLVFQTSRIRENPHGDVIENERSGMSAPSNPAVPSLGSRPKLGLWRFS